MDRISWRASLPALAVVLLTLAAYWPALGGGYVWDDGELIVKNPDVRAGDGLLRVWFDRHSPEYLPLTYGMHWLEWRIFSGSAAGPHVINVLLHGLSAALLGIILRRLRVPGAWLAALLFALHPVAVASAAWLSERKNTLSMVFYLGSILAYLRFDERSGADRASGRWYVLSLGLFLLALLSKTSVVMLPVVLLLLAWWRQGKVRGRDLVRMVPFFALSLALGLVTVWFQWHAAVGAAHEAVRPEGAASRIAAAGWIPWFYLWKILLPVKLCAIYERWDVDGARLLSFLPLALLAAATALLWRARKRWGAGPLVAWGCFLVSLLPVLGFVDMSFMHLSLVADHFQYVAMPAILALAAAIAAHARAGAGRATTVGVAICLAAMAAVTFQRSAEYRDDVALWRQSVSCSPRNARAYGNLGVAYTRAGAPDEAVRCLDKALELDPQYVIAWRNRGEAHSMAGQYAEAIRDCDQAIALKPDFADAWFTRGNACARAGRAEEALRDLDRAIALKSDSAEAYISRGKIHAAAGRYAEAIRDFGHAAALEPDNAEAWFSRGAAYARAGRAEEALADLSRAIALRPGDADAYYNRGSLYLDAGRSAEAIRDYDRAIALRPDYADAWYNRANAYAAAGRPAEAIRDYSRAIELRPRDPDAYYNRAIVRRRLKQESEALADFHMVRKLGGTVPEELLRSDGPSAQPTR
ncbi:MAG: tetratricopeptide repeat protein [Candidatus Brocadiia bacterium]